MKEFYFEKLDVWQTAREFVKDLYLVTHKFPTEEKYGIVSQIRRSALSISANIAEGMTRKSDKDKARFINIAFSSAIETINFLIISNDLGILTNDQYNTLRDKVEKITNQLNSLYITLKQ